VADVRPLILMVPKRPRKHYQPESGFPIHICCQTGKKRQKDVSDTFSLHGFLNSLPPSLALSFLYHTVSRLERRKKGHGTMSQKSFLCLIHPRTAEAGNLKSFQGPVLKCRGCRNHRAFYFNELVIHEIRNNASAIFQNFLFRCCKIEFVHLW
jgi:hypothetical protein